MSRSRRSFLRTAAALAGGAPIVSPLSHARAASGKGPLMAYVGTFSSTLGKMLPTQVDLPPGNGRGIHLFQVDRKTGALTAAGVVEMGTSPNCIAINAAGTFLYSTNETDKAEDGESGTLSAFAISRADGKLTLLNTVSSGAHGPTHLSIHPSGKFIFAANYFGGAVSVLPILPDGKLGPPNDVKKDVGTIGPKKATNAPPGSFAFSGHDISHAHMAQPDPSGRFVMSANLALDQIMTWKFDESAGKLTANDPAFVSVPPGDGPRHFAFHPNGRWFYSLQEEGSTLMLFDYDGAKGKLTAHRRSPACRRAMREAISPRRSWFPPMGSSSMPRTGCMMASRGSRSEKMERSLSWVRNGRAVTIRGVSISIRRGVFSIRATRGRTTSRSFV